MPPSANAASRASPLSSGPRLLFDENLAVRLSRDLASAFPGSVHVSQVGLRGAGDLAIWDYACANSLMLVTKDQDFHVLSVLRGHPPKSSGFGWATAPLPRSCS